jgi:hypothetical protein
MKKQSPTKKPCDHYQNAFHDEERILQEIKKFFDALTDDRICPNQIVEKVFEIMGVLIYEKDTERGLQDRCIDLLRVCKQISRRLDG